VLQRGLKIILRTNLEGLCSRRDGYTRIRGEVVGLLVRIVEDFVGLVVEVGRVRCRFPSRCVREGRFRIGSARDLYFWSWRLFSLRFLLLLSVRLLLLFLSLSRSLFWFFDRLYKILNFSDR